MKRMNLQIKIKNITFSNPVFAASGTFGYGEEYAQVIDVNQLGCIFTKGLSLDERQGNDGLRIMEVPSGMINRIGLQNVGLASFIRDKLPFLKKLKTKTIVNVAGFNEAEFMTIVKQLDKYKVICGYEINVSCPNVKQGGIAFSASENSFRSLIFKLREQTEKLLIVKLSPFEGNIYNYARLCEKAGIDAVTVANTFKSALIDTETQQLKIKGGLSGPAVFPVVLNLVWELYQMIRIPIIASGGIFNTDSAIQYLLAGAAGLQIGTWNFIEPDISLKVISGIKDYLKNKKIDDVTRLIGKANVK